MYEKRAVERNACRLAKESTGPTSFPTHQASIRSHLEIDQTPRSSPSPSRDMASGENIVFSSSRFYDYECSATPCHWLPESREPPALPSPYKMEVFLNAAFTIQDLRKVIYDIGQACKEALREEHVDHYATEYRSSGKAVLIYIIWPYRARLHATQSCARRVQYLMVSSADGRKNFRLADVIENSPIALHPIRMEPQGEISMPSTKSSVMVAGKKKKKSAKPDNYRERQNLVEAKYEIVSKRLLKKTLLDESEKKIYLRGPNVAFIQVKCNPALNAVEAFLEQILADSLIEILESTIPYSRKKDGKKKGFLIYLKCKTPEMVDRILQIFESFKQSKLKCRRALFPKENGQAELPQDGEKSSNSCASSI